MQQQNFNSLTTKELQRRKQLAAFALYTVGIGATVAIFATFYSYSVSDLFPTTTFVVTLLALLAAIPTYKEHKAVVTVLAKRNR